MAHSNLLYIENGKAKSITSDVITKLARVFKVDTDWFGVKVESKIPHKIGKLTEGEEEIILILRSMGDSYTKKLAASQV